ncbi:PLP-dependent aminotransferase family protein [Fodinicola acaciae]|uniref:MocR-like pyridoxine biosynthesis transcription factor PdxR n=1 Tax=Fodinicola acaciae TaxID=2681555 RepID=UPI0013D83260|nr:PLP-dependent aminotransferase family protein [Fodinicola acaciae]
MDFHVSLAGRGDLAARIYRQLHDAILDGRLRPGERLPSARELAARLEVSRNTVAAAYERLTAEGFLVGKVGAGTYVQADALGPAKKRQAPGGGSVQPRPLWRGLAARTPTAAGPYDFRVGMPDPRLFPLESWRRLVARELRPGLLLARQYADPSGYEPLRTAIARHVGVSRSVRADADDVVVTNGAQQAVDLAARVLVEPGGCVAVEEPGYPPVRMLFRSLGARIVSVPVDAEGIDVTAIPKSARLVYTTPSHQFPLGITMSLRRRAALLDWAQRNDAVIIEDDYDSEFRFSDRPLEPLQSIDRFGRVVYVGSFSKTLIPMLRLGFLVAPASLQPALRMARQLSDWHAELSTQAALARFVDDGLLARHIRRATRAYAVRYELVLDALQGQLARWLRIVPSVSGLHVCATVRPEAHVDIPDVITRAAKRGIALESLAGYCSEEPAVDGLVLGYGGIDAELIPPALRQLAAVFRGE